MNAKNLQKHLLMAGILLWGGFMNAQHNYCTPPFPNGCNAGEYIHNFSTSGAETNIQNLNSGCSPNGYGDFTNMEVSVFQGRRFDFLIEPDTAITVLLGYVIWIDWNDNGSFEDPGEQVWSSMFPTNTSFAGTIDVPALATYGTKRMRVRAGYYGPPPHPCNMHAPWGEAEDYTIRVLPFSNLDVGVVSIDSPSVFCPGDQDVKVTIRNYGNGYIDSLIVNWSVDGVLQSPVSVTDPLDTVGGSGSLSTQVTLGTVNFSAGQVSEVIAWTSMPNGEVDTVTFNDSVTATLGTSLSGNYTINSAQPTNNTNFNNFSDLAEALRNFDICGPVNVTVEPNSGPYAEIVTFDQMSGSSVINTVTIEGNNENLEIIGGNALTLDGAEWFTITRLNILNLGTVSGRALRLINEANHNTFSNCTFQVNLQLQSDDAVSINGNYNTFSNNEVIGGHSGMVVNGASASDRSVGNKLLNNTVRDFYFYGIAARSQDSLEMTGNEIHRENRLDPYVAIGIQLQNGISHSRIMSNRIHSLFAQNLNANYYGNAVSMSSASGDPNDYNVFANNVIYDIVHKGPTVAIMLNGNANSYWNFYHNTVVMDNNSNSGYSGSYNAIRCTGPQNNIRIKNNLFSINEGTQRQHILNFENGGAQPEIDHNAYYVHELDQRNQSRLAFFGQEIETFADWQAFNSGAFDANSVFGMTPFSDAANGEFKPKSPALNGIGADLTAEVSYDIDSISRPANPDPGAWEFEPDPGVDIAVLAFESMSGICAGNHDINVSLVNFASDTAETVYLSWRVNQVSQGTVIINQPFIPGEVIEVTLGNIALSGGVLYDIDVRVDSIKDFIDNDPLNNELSALDVRTGLDGNYTINRTTGNSATNFSSFTEFAEVVAYSGVCGDVIVDVVAGSGDYRERVVFDAIPNSSVDNQITINGNGNRLVYLANSQEEQATLTLNESKYFTIDSLEIVAEGKDPGEYGWALLMPGANHVTIKNCLIQANYTTNERNFYPIVMAVSPNNFGAPTANYNTIENNIIEGGLTGISILGMGSCKGNVIRNNEIREFIETGIFSRMGDSLIIDNNNIHCENRVFSGFATFRGISLNSTHQDCYITNNQIHSNNYHTNPSSSQQIGITINSAGGGNADNYIFNNIISDFTGGGFLDGISISSSADWKIYHNTIAFDLSHTAQLYSNPVRGIHTSSSSGIEIKNNLIYIKRDGSQQTGLSFSVNATYPDFPISDYNAIYIDSTANGTAYTGATDFSTLHASPQDWQAEGFDSNGVFSNPIFRSLQNRNYMPANADYEGIGTDLLAIVAEDIFGEARTATPDPGAIQMMEDPCGGPLNLAIDSLLPDTAYISWLSSEDSWEIEWGYEGFVPGSGIGTVISSIFDPNYALSGVNQGTCIDVYVRELCGQSDSSEWTGPLVVCFPHEYDLSAQGIVSPSADVCGDTAIEVRVRLRNEGYHPADSFHVHVQIDPLNLNVSTFYTGTINPGVTDTILVGTFAAHSGNIQLAAYPVHPLDGNPDNDTIRSIRQIRDAQPIQIFASPDTLCEVDDVLLWVESSTFDGAIFWINESGDTLGTSDSLELMQVSESRTIRLLHQANPGDCDRIASEKQIVWYDAPQANVTDDHLSGSADENGFSVHFDASGSSFGAHYEWDFGDGSTTSSSSDSITHLFTENGDYTVRLIVSNACGSDTTTLNIAIRGISITKYLADNDLRVFPNPNNGRFTVEYQKSEMGEVVFELTDMSGKVIWTEIHQNFSGEYHKEFDLNAASGLYMLRMRTAAGQIVKKVMIK